MLPKVSQSLGTPVTGTPLWRPNVTLHNRTGRKTVTGKAFSKLPNGVRAGGSLLPSQTALKSRSTNVSPLHSAPPPLHAPTTTDATTLAAEPPALPTPCYANPATLVVMGGLCSSHKHHPETLLNAGDVILFAGRNSRWLVTKVGTWSGFSNVGFLLKHPQDPDRFTLCYSGAPLARGEGDPDESDFGTVRLCPLDEFLEAGQFDQIVVRKLAVPLAEAEEQLVRSFAVGAEGQVLPGRVSLLMAPCEDSLERVRCSWCCCLPRVERFFCSELVVEMLERAGRVVKNNREYVPRGGLAKAGRVLGPAMRVDLGRRGRMGS